MGHDGGKSQNMGEKVVWYVWGMVGGWGSLLCMQVTCHSMKWSVGKRCWYRWDTFPLSSLLNLTAGPQNSFHNLPVSLSLSVCCACLTAIFLHHCMRWLVVSCWWCCPVSDARVARLVVCHWACGVWDSTLHLFPGAVPALAVARVCGAQHVALCHPHHPHSPGAGKRGVLVSLPLHECLAMSGTTLFKSFRHSNSCFDMWFHILCSSVCLPFLLIRLSFSPWLTGRKILSYLLTSSFFYSAKCSIRVKTFRKSNYPSVSVLNSIIL